MTREVRLIWAVVAATLAALVATYSRLPASELYNVSRSGIRAALGRAVVDLNFPDSLIALAVLGVVGPSLTPRGKRLAVVAALLCAVGPAFVRQGDLDVRWVNAVAAVGVALAFALTFFARGPHPPVQVRGDGLRIVLAVVLTLVALEWVAAALGFSLDVVFQSSRIVSYHGNAPHHAVHRGMHHGLYGLLLALTALLLSRLPNRISPLLALLVAYGVGNMLNDLWLEQVAERGWTSWTIPSCLEPGATWTWLAVLLATPVIWFMFRGSAAATDAEADLRRTRSAAQPS
ncbi:MAG TPA: hypothetical protein VIK66_07180 [Gaiellaceae bacterium]